MVYSDDADVHRSWMSMIEHHRERCARDWSLRRGRVGHRHRRVRVRACRISELVGPDVMDELEDEGEGEGEEVGGEEDSGEEDS